jgi:hypothetical protein
MFVQRHGDEAINRIEWPLSLACTVQPKLGDEDWVAMGWTVLLLASTAVGAVTIFSSQQGVSLSFRLWPLAVLEDKKDEIPAMDPVLPPIFYPVIHKIRALLVDPFKTVEAARGDRE